MKASGSGTVANMRRIFFLRRKCSSGTKTTDEKAAELSKEGWPTLRKYSPIWVPALTLIALTVDVINSTSDRNMIEPYLPAYISLVRRYIGFGDEDPVEIQRIKETLKAQEESFDALIELSFGVEVREDNVDGKLSYGDFYQKMQSKYGHEGCRINKITFLDSNLKNNVGQDGITHSSVVTSSEYQKKGTKDEMSGTLSSAGEAEYKVASMVNSPLGRSIWESKNNDTDINTADVESSSSFSPLSSSSSSSRNFPLNASKNGNSVNNADSGRTSRGVGRGLPSVWSTAIFGAQKSEFDDILLNKTVMISKFENIVSTVMSDWKHFKMIENPNILVVHGNSSNNMLGNKTKTGDLSASKDQTKLSKLIEVEEAKMAILSLEARIKLMKTEKQHGNREIDEIDKEIKEMKNQISKLRKQYFNYFYFF